MRHTRRTLNFCFRRVTEGEEAFREYHALQCGFCTPGMVLSAIGIVDDNPDPSHDEIRHELEGNICRCTGYHNIVLAIEAAAKEMRG